MASQSYVYNAYTSEMRKIKGGPFLKTLFSQMQDFVRGSLNPKGRKMFLYCAHDWSIVNVLSALNVWERQMPRFSALTTIELHQFAATNKYYVEVNLYYFIACL